MGAALPTEPEKSADRTPSGPGTVTPAAPGPAGPRITFQGNSVDLTSLGALATGALMLVSCLTCNMGFYCLPLVPVVLGLIGLLQARQAVDPERTRRFAWLGIAAGALIIFVTVTLVVLYMAFLFFMALISQSGRD
jgi:hypothetical protein